MPSQFDSKIFNPEAFGKYVERVPNLFKNTILTSGILNVRTDYRDALKAQSGGNYYTAPMYGLLGRSLVPYDGDKEVIAINTDTYSQSVVATGLAMAWKETDFSYDIASANFMDNVAQQVALAWAQAEQEVLFAVTTGLSGSENPEKAEFVKKHFHDLSQPYRDGTGDGLIADTTLLDAIYNACGDNQKAFSMVFMHSKVAARLQKLQVLQYAKYTDANGIMAENEVTTWFGRRVIVDDSLPVENVSASYRKTADTAVVVGKTYYTYASGPDGGTYTAVASPSTSNIGTYYEMLYPAHTVYLTIAAGAGAYNYCDVGAKVPYEVWREPFKHGGENTLITRKRFVYAPKGFSFTKTNMIGLSPTIDELKDTANWDLVRSTSGTPINHRSIPIAIMGSIG
jgi:hypothetical protein